jgi:hypothetical protein
VTVLLRNPPGRASEPVTVRVPSTWGTRADFGPAPDGELIGAVGAGLFDRHA